MSPAWAQRTLISKQVQMPNKQLSCFQTPLIFTSGVQTHLPCRQQTAGLSQTSPTKRDDAQFIQLLSSKRKQMENPWKASVVNWSNAHERVRFVLQILAREAHSIETLQEFIPVCFATRTSMSLSNVEVIRKVNETKCACLFCGNQYDLCCMDKQYSSLLDCLILTETASLCAIHKS